MAIAHVVDNATANKVSGTALLIATTTDHTAGNLVVAAIGMDPNAGTVSVADDQLNTWVGPLVDVTNSAGARLVVFASILTNTITGNVTFTLPTTTARAGFTSEFSGVASATNDDEQTNTGSADPATSTAITPATDGNLVIQIMANEREPADSGTGNWGSTISGAGTTGGGAASNISIKGAYEIQSSATARGVDWNFNTAGDWAVAVLCWAPTGVTLLPSPTNFGAHAVF